MCIANKGKQNKYEREVTHIVLVLLLPPVSVSLYGKKGQSETVSL